MEGENILSILFLRFRIKGAECQSELFLKAFNSLFEIRPGRGTLKGREKYELSILFLRFAGRLIRRMAQAASSPLSILFLRFPIPINWDIGDTLTTFNSLFEIRHQSKHSNRFSLVKSFNSLFEIPTSPCLYQSFIPKNFQFSFWDSSQLVRIALIRMLVFQFSFWDSQRRPARWWPGNMANFQFSFWDSSLGGVYAHLSKVW